MRLSGLKFFLEFKSRMLEKIILIKIVLNFPITQPKSLYGDFKPGKLNPHTPIAQKLADEVVFHRFQGDEAEFFLDRTSMTPSQIFDVHLLENTCFESDGFIAYPNE